MASSYETRLGDAPEEGIKAPVAVATNAAITLLGEQTIKSVAVVAGDRVLVRNQADAVENGIYTCSTGEWTRTKDWNNADDVIAGQLVADASDGSIFQAFFDGDYTPDTTEVIFSAWVSVTGELVIVDLINDLRSQVPTISEWVQVRGNSSVGDGDGYFYYWDDSSTATDDGYRVIKVTTITIGRWIRVFDGTVQTVDSSGDDSLYDHPGNYDGQQAQVAGYYTPGDGGGGLFYWDAASTASDDAGVTILPTGHTGAGRWVRVRTEYHWETAWYGPNAAGISATFTAYRAAGDFVGYVRINPGTYTISSTIDVSPYTSGGTAEEQLYVDARGAEFNTSVSSGKAFVTHDESYDRTETKRRLYWLGGYFRNSLGTGNAAVAIETHYMRMFKLSEAMFEDYDIAVDVWGLDTYHIIDNYFFANDIGINVPTGTSAFGSAPDSADVTLQLMIHRNHFSITGGTSAVKGRARLGNLSIKDNSFNGNTSGPQIDLEFDDEDGNDFSGAISISDNHFEQFSTYAIQMTVDSGISPGNTGWLGVNINGNWFRSSKMSTDAYTLNLPGVRDGRLDGNMFNVPKSATIGAAIFGTFARHITYGNSNSHIVMRNTELLDLTNVGKRSYIRLEQDVIPISVTAIPAWGGNAGTGTHTAADSATVMTDSTADFVVDELIGTTITNSTDGSTGIVTDNTETTVTVSSLSGGSDNTFQTGDSYSIGGVRLESDTSATIRAWDAVSSNVPQAILFPVGYTVILEVAVSDSASASAAAGLFSVHGPGGANEGIRIPVSGETNNRINREVGFVPCDPSDGTIDWSASFTGAGDAEVSVRILAVHF